MSAIALIAGIVGYLAIFDFLRHVVMAARMRTSRRTLKGR